MPFDIVVLFLVLPVRLDLNGLSDLTVIYYIQFKTVLSPLVEFKHDSIMIQFKQLVAEPSN